MNRVIQDYKHTYLFYFLATIIPWSFWGLAAYISHSTDYRYPGELASLFAFVGLLSPTLIAFVLIYRNKRLMSDVLQRMINLRSGKPVYWLLTLLLMPASILLAQLVSLLFGYSASQFAFSESYSFTSGVFPVWFLLIAAPLVEELAWHSYGTDCLCKRFNLMTASLIFAFYWGVWHIPLSFINDYYHSNLVQGGWIHGVNFLVSLFPFVIIMNWLYFRTGRSILSAIIFHVTAGYFNEIFATHPDSKVIQTGLLIVLATLIVLKEKRFFFEDFSQSPVHPENSCSLRKIAMMESTNGQNSIISAVCAGETPR
jgi:membrane protease YdiL (CAAX protease family)